MDELIKKFEKHLKDMDDHIKFIALTFDISEDCVLPPSDIDNIELELDE